MLDLLLALMTLADEFEKHPKGTFFEQPQMGKQGSQIAAPQLSAIAHRRNEGHQDHDGHRRHCWFY